jgi:hypothetical protein
LAVLPLLLLTPGTFDEFGLNVSSPHPPIATAPTSGTANKPDEGALRMADDLP